MWIDTANAALPSLTVQTQRLPAVSLLKDIMENGPSIISGWWRKFHYLVPNWIQLGLLNSYIAGFVELLEFCGRKGRRGDLPQHPEPPLVQAQLDGFLPLVERRLTTVVREQICTTRETHEFLLFTWIFFDYDGVKVGDYRPNLELAIAATTTTKPIFDPAAFPTVKKQLSIQPRALRSRLREVLERKDDDPRSSSQTYKLV